MVMKFGSLFAGIGGLDLGLERAGMECAWQVEIDDYCRQVLTKNWPNVPKFRDVREVHGIAAHSDRKMWHCSDCLRPVDLVCGGFPCQPFSSASRGRRRGTECDRWLWPEMFRVIKELRPNFVLAENVTHFDGPGLEQVVSDLEGIAYQVAPTLEIPACAFGHDHWRPRIWILAHTYSYSQPSSPIDEEVAKLQGGHSDTGGMGKKNGIPSRMVRLRALGNAVVPQCAEFIGKLILESVK